MINNERGSSLLTVMLVFVIFTTLGLVLITASIGGAKRTEIRMDEVTDNLSSLAYLKEAVAQIQSFVDRESLSTLPINEYDDKLHSFLSSINSSNLGYTIENLTLSPEYIGKIRSEDYTRVLLINTPLYKQKIYITAMPSFLKYALGSRANLTMNGSPLLKGNIYASESLHISNWANYKYNVKKSRETTLPAIEDTVEVTVESDQIYLCESTGTPCYDYEWKKNDFLWKQWNPKDIQSAFSKDSEGTAVYKTEKEKFVDVDIHETFREKMMESGFSPFSFGSSNTSEDKTNIIVSELNKKTVSDPSEGVMIINDFNNLDSYSNQKSFLYQGDANIDTEDIQLKSDQWLIINGDARFESKGLNRMDVKGNILITGNLEITGKLSFESVIYVLGSTKLKNVNITCYQNKCKDENTTNDEDAVLILMTEGDLEISRVNKFIDVMNKNENKIKGYLYTSSKADIYAVGSLLTIDGGIFSKNNLTVNSFRGNTEDNGSDLDFKPNDAKDASRLTISNNKKLFLNQAQGLPKVDSLTVIVDRIEKK